MNVRMFALLACPECRSALAVVIDRREGDEIEEGTLRCEGCGRAYPIRNGIPRFVDGDAYASSFSLQWQRFRQVQLDSLREGDETRRRFVAMTGLTAEELSGRRVLEIGCGPGKFIETVVEMGAEAFGVDISFAVDAARDNFGARPDVHFIQADVFKLPFVDGSFDLVYSLGVLHHTPDCQAAFAKLPRLAAPGGLVAIWVYANEIVPHFNRRLRSITRRMPSPLLYGACLAVVPLTYLFNIPYLRAPLYGLRAYFQWISWGGWRERWLDTVDWYSCWYQSAHSYPEVHRWFLDAGLNDIRLGDIAVSMRGRAPETSPDSMPSTVAP